MVLSLRSYLLLGTAITMILALGLLGFTVEASVRRTLISEFDNVLLSKAQTLASFVEQHEKHVSFEFDSDRMPEFLPGSRSGFFEVWIEGKLLGASSSLGKEHLSHGKLGTDQLGFTALTLPDRHPGRLVAFPYAAYVDEDNEESTQKKQGVAYVALDTGQLDHTLANIRWAIAGLSCSAIIVCATALFGVVTRAVRPVKALARRIEQMSEADLSSRLDVANLPAELQPIVDRLNGLLGRLENAFVRERAFTADVAHELRTPIAGLRTTLEVCRSRPRDSAAYVAAIDRSLKMIHSMQTVIENLLLLARAEAGQLALVVADADLADLIRDAWSAFSARATESKISIQLNVPDTCVMPVDSGKLRIVLNNLFDNAVSYTNAGGTIDVELNLANRVADFRISNTNHQITPTEVPRLFERFWRKDEARSQNGLHAGLGLSLCQRLLALSGVSITAHVEQDRFIVRFVLNEGLQELIPA